MNNLPTTAEFLRALNNPDKYSIVWNKNAPVAIKEIKPLMTTHADNNFHVHHIIAVSKRSSLRDDTWDENHRE